MYPGQAKQGQQAHLVPTTTTTTTPRATATKPEKPDLTIKTRPTKTTHNGQPIKARQPPGRSP
jgi:hypothetical protein